MSNEKDNMKKGNGETPETTGDQEDVVEGYAFCSTQKQKCNNDCIPSGPMLTPLY